MTDKLVEFKDAVINPLKKTIEQYKAPTLSQFKTIDDVKVQWARAEGMEMSLNHIEGVYSSMMNAQPTAQDVEILAPQ